MKHRVFGLLTVSGTVLLTTGCAGLFPTNHSASVSHWRSYAAVQAAFDQIVPDHTTTNDLKTLGFDPTTTPNIKILTYVDIMQIFMPNPAIQKQDLAAPVRACIEAREKSCAYAVELKDTFSKRHGNLFLDIFGFKRKTHETGWDFKGLILIKDDVVVYKLVSGEPQISDDQRNVKPLGPLQEIDGSVIFGVAR